MKKKLDDDKNVLVEKLENSCHRGNENDRQDFINSLTTKELEQYSKNEKDNNNLSIFKYARPFFVIAIILSHLFISLYPKTRIIFITIITIIVTIAYLIKERDFGKKLFKKIIEGFAVFMIIFMGLSWAIIFILNKNAQHTLNICLLPIIVYLMILTFSEKELNDVIHTKIFNDTNRLTNHYNDWFKVQKKYRK